MAALTATRSQAPMEEPRAPKRLCLVSRPEGLDGHPGELGHSDLGADGPTVPEQPEKPVAYVRPMTRAAPARAAPARAAPARAAPARAAPTRAAPARLEPAPPAERGRAGRRSRRAQRNNTRATSRRSERGSRWQITFPEWPGHLQDADLQAELEDHEEPGDVGEAGARQSTSTPFVDVVAAGDRLPGSRGVGIQTLRLTSGYWAVVGQQASVIYPCVGFTPLAGSVLRFTRTSFGTHVFGVPVFFTRIAR